MSFTDSIMPSYFIYRDIPAGQPLDLTAPLAFCPPKDSDELFDALRAKYPHLRTHQERTRQAVIEYLLEETQLAQMPIEQLSTPHTSTSVNVSPWEASMQSMSSDSSTWSSPELFNLATPSFGMSPQPELPSLGREGSVSTSFISQTATTPQPLEQMTGVFSLSDSVQTKQRVRRKMTDAEKAEYRKRRIVKACDKCAKRKRKCNHNQPEMETVASKSHKVTKVSPQSRSPVQAQQHQQQHLPLVNDTSVFDQAFMTDISMPSFDDFTILPEDPMLPVGSEWSYSDAPDWAFMDPTTNTMQPMNKTDLEHGNDLDLLQSGYDGDIPWMDNSLPLMEVPTAGQQPTHTLHLHESYGLDGSGVLELNNSLGTTVNANAPQQQCIRNDTQFSANQQRESWSDAYANGNGANGTAAGGNGRYPSLADVTLRLTATRKAVKAFGNLLPKESRRRATLQNVSLRKIALLALSGISAAQSIATGLQTQQSGVVTSTSALRTARGGHHASVRARDVRQAYTAYTCNAPDCRKEWTTASALKKHQVGVHSRHAMGAGSCGLLGERSSGGFVNEGLTTSLSHGRSNRDEGRHDKKKTSSDDDIPNGDDIPSDNVPGAGEVDTSAPGATQLSANEQRPPRYHLVKSHARSLGQGIATMKNPTTELYMLKRRITTGPLSEMSRASSSLTPLLMAVPHTETLRRFEPETVTPRNYTLGEERHVERGAPAHLEKHGHPKAAAGPVHTRPNDSTPSGYQDAHDRVVSRWPANGSGPRNSGAWAVNNVGAGMASTSAQANSAAAAAGVEKWTYRAPTLNEATAYRLCDHMRRRDHFGRGIAALATLAALSSLLFLLGIFPQGQVTTTYSLSILLLTLVEPISEGRLHTAGTPFAAQLWGTDWQWIVWNSAWAKAEEVYSVFQQGVRGLCAPGSGYLSRGHKVGGHGRINSIGKKAVLV